MHKSILSTILLALAAAPSGIAQSNAAAHSQPSAGGTGGWGFDLSAEDTSVRPGDNFFLYANGSYIRKIAIPADRTSYGLLSNMNELSDATMHSLLEDELVNPGPTSAERKVVAFYRAFMDEGQVETLGIKPLKIDLDRVRAIKSRSAMSAFMGSTSGGFGRSIFRTEVVPDSANTTRHILELSQSGLGLPGRQYYLKPEYAVTRQKYVTYVTSVLRLVEWPNAEREPTPSLVSRPSWLMPDGATNRSAIRERPTTPPTSTVSLTRPPALTFVHFSNRLDTAARHASTFGRGQRSLRLRRLSPALP